MSDREYLDTIWRLTEANGHSMNVKELLVLECTRSNQAARKKKPSVVIQGFKSLDRVPLGKWKQAVQQQSEARLCFLRAVASLYLPGCRPEDPLPPQAEEPQKLAGKMALLMLAGKQEELAMPQEQEAAAQPPEPQPLPKTEPPVRETELAPQPVPAPAPVITDPNTPGPRPVRDVQYICQIQVSNNGVHPFYNCYPLGEIAPKGGIIQYGPGEAAATFPTLGNFNIYCRQSEQQAARRSYAHGGLIVIGWSKNMADANYNASGELNRTNWRVDFSKLSSRNSGNHARRKLYAVLRLPDAEALLGKGEDIDLGQYGYVPEDLPMDESAMVQVGTRYAGPFELERREDTVLLRTAAVAKRNHIVSVYNDDGTGRRLLSVPMDSPCRGFGQLGKQYIFIEGLSASDLDVITEEQLQEELSRLLKGGRDELHLDTAFRDARLPKTVHTQRIQRLREAYERMMERDRLLDQHTEMIRNALQDAVAQDDPRFDALFADLLEKPGFADRLQATGAAKRKLDATLALVRDAEDKAAEALSRCHQAQTYEELETGYRRLTQQHENLQLLVDALNEKKDNLMASIAESLVHRQMGVGAEDLSVTSGGDDRLSAFYRQAAQQGDNHVTVDTLVERVQRHRPGYSYNEVVNLFICLQQSFLTVIAGAPGTGKTTISTILAHALGLDAFGSLPDAGNIRPGRPDELNRFAFIPVERGWTSKRDFIGYYNPLTKSYDKSNHRAFDLLRTISGEGREGFPCVLLLDEANLSPMEYYWADYMGACDQLRSAPPVTIGGDLELRVTPPLRFLATINNDQTTEPLSPRLIDRSWVIRLPQNAIASEIDFDHEEPIRPVLLSRLNDLFGSAGRPDLGEETALYEQISDMCSAGLGFTFSSRGALAVRRYYDAASRLFRDTEQATAGRQALDFAVAQRLLPKLSGTGNAYRETIDRLADLCGQEQLLKSEAILRGVLRRSSANMGFYAFF